MDLTSIMNYNMSDKGSGHHNYTSYYSTLFEPIRNKKLNILEIGIGSINPSIPSNMSGTIGKYKPGASLRGWRDYFPNATIYGCDIDRDILFTDDRIKTFYLNQCDPVSIKEQVVDKNIIYDIIIDDGLHNFHVNVNVLSLLYEKLNMNGFYIIEDIVDFDPYLFHSHPIIQTISNSNGFCSYVQLANSKNNADNNLLVVRKHK